jgi:phosphatidylglycerophosphatase A
LIRPGISQRFAYFVATFAGVGRAPVVPGTWGTLAAVPLAGVLAWTGSPLLYALALAVLVALGIWAAGVVEDGEGATDPGLVVVDEAAGFLVTVFLLPPSALTYLAAFLVFRVLDILKPPPARQAEKFPAGFGIMADDLIVGVYGNLILRAGIHYLGRP